MGSTSPHPGDEDKIPEHIPEKSDAKEDKELVLSKINTLLSFAKFR